MTSKSVRIPPATLADSIGQSLMLHDDILIAAHSNPDGDALGACAAMGYIVAALGKRFCIYNESPLPQSFDWLPLPCPLLNDLEKLPFTPQLAVILDCGDIKRVGQALEKLLPTVPSISLDHHLETPPYASLINWTDPSMAATGQMVAAVAKALSIPLQGPLAENIFVSIVTDTGSFSHSNTTATVMHLAAELLDNGLDVTRVRNNMENRQTISGLRLQGELLSRFSLHEDKRVAFVSVSQDDFRRFSATKEDLDSIVNRLCHMRGIDIAAVLREESPTESKVSMRSTGIINVRAIAASLGGGGHVNAAGATIAKPLEQAQTVVLTAINAYLSPLQAGV